MIFVFSAASRMIYWGVFLLNKVNDLSSAMSLSNYATLFFDTSLSNFQYVAPKHTFRHLTTAGAYQDVLTVAGQKIGIGTTNPLYDLDVRGNLNVTQNLIVYETIFASNVQGIGTISAQNISSCNMVFRNEPSMQTFAPVKVSYDTYYKTFSWLYRGTENSIREINNVYVQSHLYTGCNEASYLQSSNFGYDMRVMDITNNTLLSQKGFSNSTPETQVLSLSNLQPVNCTLELQVRKKAFGEYVNIDALTIGYPSSIV